MSIDKFAGLSGIEKASALLMALGTEVSAQVFKYLSDEEIESLSTEIIRLREVHPDITKAVVREFKTECGTRGDENRPEKILNVQKAGAHGGKKPFKALHEADAARIAGVLKHEPPSIIAIALTNVPPEKAGEVYSRLDESVQEDVAMRICNMQPVEPEVLAAIEEGLHMKLSAQLASVEEGASAELLATILGSAGRTAESAILDRLCEKHPGIGERVKGMMFEFDDFHRLDDRSIRIVLLEIGPETLRTALKGASEEVKAAMFRNMSEMAADSVREGMELTGPASPKKIAAAQQEISTIVRKLLSCGRIRRISEREEMIY